jgi:hypothetical protein
MRPVAEAGDEGGGSTASPDDTSTVACQPQPVSRKRTPWGSAVPRVSMPTSQASAAPACWAPS